VAHAAEGHSAVVTDVFLENLPTSGMLKQTHWLHRNLSIRTINANILGEKNLAKSLLISTLEKVIYYIGTFLQGSTKPLFTLQKYAGEQLKKFALLKHASSM
jgi:hypothetical protein